jgi:hypothetical protein
MEEQAMLARDLVLRVCAGATELDPQWIRVDGKVTTPFLVPRDRNLVRAVIAAGRSMGVERLLVCRTRPEFSYEPVTEIPLHTDTLIDLVRGWGPDPTDFLVCVEDFSAAVLITADDLTKLDILFDDEVERGAVARYVDERSHSASTLRLLEFSDFPAMSRGMVERVMRAMERVDPDHYAVLMAETT